METKETKKSNKKLLSGVIGVLVFAAVIALLAGAYAMFREKPVEGSKLVTIEVVNKAQESTSYEVRTDAEYLRQAMEETGGLTFGGTDSEYGFTVDTVNGEVADFNEGAYWAFYVNNDYCNYGVDSQPIADGDAFKIEYTVYVAE